MKIYIKKTDSFTADEYEKYYSMMSEKRKNAVDRLRNQNDKIRSVLGEATVRRSIAERFNVSESEVIFDRTEKGKPFCVNFDICFGISHSKEYVAAAVSEHNVGIDIEKIRQVEARVTKIACDERDKGFVFNDLPRDNFDENSKKRFFLLWTAKEAYFKFCGTGIVKLQDVSYCDIKDNCTVFEGDGYIMTVYSEKENGNYELINMA